MKRKTEILREYMVVGLLLLFSVASLIGSTLLYIDTPGVAEAGMFPLLMSSLMTICLLGVLGRTIWTSKQIQDDSKMGALARLIEALREEFPLRTIFFGLCIVGYGILLALFGFYISTAIFMLVSMLGLYQGKRVKLVLCVTAFTLVGVYVIIEMIFRIPLP